MGFVVVNGFLLSQALLEYGQALIDIFYTKNYPRALIMCCAGTSSIALIWV